jgi:sigma-E factor negative regulatory protein RseC
MIETSARVISNSNGTVLVEPSVESGCGGCKSRSSCGVSGLAKYFSNHRGAIEVRCEAGVNAGDELQLRMSEGDLLKAGLLAYLLPCVWALVGAGVAASLGFGDAGAVLGAGLGFAAGILTARLSGWTPHLVAQRKNENSSKGETP